jgi:hypothetical protein
MHLVGLIYLNKLCTHTPSRSPLSTKFSGFPSDQKEGFTFQVCTHSYCKSSVFKCLQSAIAVWIVDRSPLSTIPQALRLLPDIICISYRSPYRPLFHCHRCVLAFRQLLWLQCEACCLLQILQAFRKSNGSKGNQSKPVCEPKTHLHTVLSIMGVLPLYLYSACRITYFKFQVGRSVSKITRLRARKTTNRSSIPVRIKCFLCSSKHADPLKVANTSPI